MDARVEEQLKLGVEALARNRADLADPLFRTVLDREPSHPYAATALAACLRLQRRWDEALEQSRWAVARHPDYQYAHFKLASVLAVREVWDEALPHALQAVRLAPDRARYYGLLANIYHETDRFAQSLATTVDGLAVQADHLYVQKIRVVSLAATDQVGAAEALLAAILRAAPATSASLFCGGWMNWTIGRDEAAVVFLRRALERNPLSGDSHAILGLCLARLGRRTESVTALSESLRLNPSISRSRTALGQLSLASDAEQS